MRERIERFLSQRLLIEFGDEIDEHSDLFQLGLMDSQAYVDLIRFVEKELDVRFTDDEILSNVLVSLSGIVELATAAQKRRALGSAGSS